MQNSHTKAVLLLHRVSKCIQTLQNTDEVIKNGHAIATGIASRRQAKQKHNTICVGHHYPKTNTTHIRRHIYKQLEVKLNRTFKTEIVADITIRNSDTYNDIT